MSSSPNLSYHTDMKTMTFTSKTVSRGCAEFGPTSLVYTDTVSEDGTVTWTVKGTCDGEWVSQSGIRSVGHTLDLSIVQVARLSSGWTVAL